MFRCEKLDVWQKAIEYADSVYAVSRGFPDDERFGLTRQIRRSAVSISSNIADGTGRSSDVGYGSLIESVSQSHIAKRQDFLDHATFDDLYQRADQLVRMMSGLRSSIKSR